MIEKKLQPIEESKTMKRRGGLFTNKANRVEKGITFSAGGNVTMSSDNTIYRFPNSFNGKQILFYGIAFNNAATVRVNCFGSAFKYGYYYAPTEPVSPGILAVKIAAERPPKGSIGQIVQSGSWFLQASTAPTFRARSIETTIVNIDWPNTSTIVARAEVIEFNNSHFDVKVNLASGWNIAGNFVCI